MNILSTAVSGFVFFCISLVIQTYRKLSWFWLIWWTKRCPSAPTCCQWSQQRHWLVKILKMSCNCDKCWEATVSIFFVFQKILAKSSRSQELSDLEHCTLDDLCRVPLRLFNSARQGSVSAVWQNSPRISGKIRLISLKMIQIHSFCLSKLLICLIFLSNWKITLASYTNDRSLSATLRVREHWYTHNYRFVQVQHRP